MVTGKELTAREIEMQVLAGDVDAEATMQRFEDRLARGLAGLINILDPDIFVFGGGVSRAERIYSNVSAKLPGYVFGGRGDNSVGASTVWGL